MTTNLLKWTLTGSKTNNKQQPNNRWIHNDDVLINGHVAYLVKFLGNVEVDQPKGLEVVKESIRKLEFQEQLKRSEGEKIKRIELTISIDGIAIREPKTKCNIHQFPLHIISYCADDKSDRKYLSFITKVQENSDRHECFVFVSDKLSEEITITIGQAFELAYRRFLDSSGRDFETKKQLVQAQKRIQELEKENTELKKRLSLQNNNHNNGGTTNNVIPPSTTTTNLTLLQSNTTVTSTASTALPTIDLSSTTMTLANNSSTTLIDLLSTPTMPRSFISSLTSIPFEPRRSLNFMEITYKLELSSLTDNGYFREVVPHDIRLNYDEECMAVLGINSRCLHVRHFDCENEFIIYNL